MKLADVTPNDVASLFMTDSRRLGGGNVLIETSAPSSDVLQALGVEVGDGASVCEAVPTLACSANRSCTAIPVNERINTDFLWQRSPFQLFGGGDGTIETAAIDYLRSYWMARHFGLPV